MCYFPKSTTRAFAVDLAALCLGPAAHCDQCCGQVAFWVGASERPGARLVTASQGLAVVALFSVSFYTLMEEGFFARTRHG